MFWADQSAFGYDFQGTVFSDFAVKAEEVLNK
jgi:hypothetical protein